MWKLSLRERQVITMSERNTIQSKEQMPCTSSEEKPVKKNISTIIGIVLAAQVVLAIIVGVLLFRRGYEQSKTGTEAHIRQTAYNSVYGITEQANHVSNDVSISLDGIREKADLEILQVDSSYIYTSDEEDSARNQTIWYRFSGTGTFTIDMRMTEFIVDNERSHVLVKAPEPSITQFSENYDKVEKLLYKDNTVSILGIISLNNGSVQEGEQIAQKMLALSRSKMIKQLEMTPAYYQAAEETGVRIITQLIKSINPDINKITVDVVYVK